MKAENPFAMFFEGDFNAKCHFWWPDGDETLEGREIQAMLNQQILILGKNPHALTTS